MLPDQRVVAGPVAAGLQGMQQLAHLIELFLVWLSALPVIIVLPSALTMCSRT